MLFKKIKHMFLKEIVRSLLGVLRKMDQRKKKDGPVWFTLNPSVKIHRETQKIEFFKKYYKIQKTKTQNVLEKSLRLSKTILVGFGSFTGSE